MDIPVVDVKEDVGGGVGDVDGSDDDGDSDHDEIGLNMKSPYLGPEPNSQS